MTAEPAALDVLPGPPPGMVGVVLALLVLAVVVLVLMAAIAGDALTRGNMGVAVRGGLWMVAAGAAMTFLLRLLRHLRDRRPALSIRPEGLTLPRRGLRLRWSEVETIGLMPAGLLPIRLHIGLTAEASRARGVRVAHVPDAAPHLGNRLRCRLVLYGLSEPPERIRSALFAAAARAGIRFVPAPAPLWLRLVEGGAQPYPRWTCAPGNPVEPA